MGDFAHIKQLITGFLQSNGASEVAETDFEEENYSALADDEGNVIHLSFNPFNNSVILMGTLGNLPDSSLVHQIVHKENAETDDETVAAELTDAEHAELIHDNFRVMQFFLGCNFLWDDSEGATFAYVADGDYMVIQRLLSVEGLSQNVFNAEILTFFEQLREWIARYAHVLDQVESGAPTIDLNIIFA